MRLRPARTLLAVLALSFAACARPADPSTWKPLTIDDPTLEHPWNVARIAERVARIRHLPLKEPITVEPIDTAGLARKFGALEMDSHVFETDAVWHAFEFAPADVSVGDRIRSSYVANTLGLYDPKEKRLFLREGVAPSEMQRLAVVHEIDHALEFQSFRENLTFGTSVDEARAVRALLEGDADVTMFAYAATAQRQSDHWVERLLNASAHRNLAESATPKVDADMPLAKALREFPYRAGTSFVAAMYGLGGFAMVDSLYAHLPRSTEQVMHPEKYLAGDLPVPVARPMAPEGYVDVNGGRMGELMLGGLLAQCGGAMPDDAVGWGGDAFSVVTDYAGKLAVLVSTVWDDVDAATRFERRIAARARCLAEKRAKKANEAIPTDLGVAREGNRVAFLEGFGTDGRDVALKALLALVGERPAAAPPFGASCALPPLVVPDNAFLMRGYVEPDRYFSEPLGLIVPLTSFEAIEGGPVEVTLWRRDAVSVASGTVRVLMTSYTPELEQRLVTTFSAASEKGAPTLHYDGASPILTGVGPARAFHWLDSGMRERVLVLAPFCDDLGTFMFEAAFAGRGPWDEIRDFLASIELHKGAPACSWLKANRAEPTIPATCSPGGSTHGDEPPKSK